MAVTAKLVCFCSPSAAQLPIGSPSSMLLFLASFFASSSGDTWFETGLGRVPTGGPSSREVGGGQLLTSVCQSLSWTQRCLDLNFVFLRQGIIGQSTNETFWSISTETSSTPRPSSTHPRAQSAKMTHNAYALCDRQCVAPATVAALQGMAGILFAFAAWCVSTKNAFLRKPPWVGPLF